MKITNKLTKNKTALQKIEKLFVSLGEELGNINEFPINIPRFFSPEKESNTKLGNLLKEAYLEVTELLKKIPLETLISEVNQINRIIIFILEGPDKVITRERLIIQIIASELESYIPKKSNYIGLIPSKQKVFQQIPDLDLDKYNLTTITNDFKLENHGIIYKDKFLIYYHPFLRRFYTANFTIGGLLKKTVSQKDIHLKLAIDPLRLTDPHWLKNLIEADYW